MLTSYSWEGEDILARKIALDLLGVSAGFYVDIGAHHPFNLSNTALLYNQGWRGINIDATPGSMELFRQHRPEDTNLEVAISDTEGRRRFTTFNQPELNGFLSDEEVRSNVARGFGVSGQFDIECRSINGILSEHARNRPIDLLTIDAEGLDYDILRSLAPEFNPVMIITETLGQFSIRDVLQLPVVQLLEGRGYVLFSRLHFSCFFIQSSQRS